MTFLVQSETAANPAMLARVAQCAAQEGELEPDAWAQLHRRTWAAAPGWDDAWSSARASHEDDPTYDPGADEAVVTDAMILSQVQGMRAG